MSFLTILPETSLNHIFDHLSISDIVNFSSTSSNIRKNTKLGDVLALQMRIDLPQNAEKTVLAISQFITKNNALFDQEIKKIGLYNENLTLTEKQLEWIPTSIKKRSWDAISIHKLPLSIFPIHILALVSLRVLLITKTQIKTVPPQIKNLKNLWWLNLSDNKIETVSKEIGELKKLQTLELSNNQLYRLPPEITTLKLKTLNLTNNYLSFPFDYQKSDPIVSSLKCLYLAYNKIGQDRLTQLKKNLNLVFSDF